MGFKTVKKTGDSKKSKKELINELEILRERLNSREYSDTGRVRVTAALLESEDRYQKAMDIIEHANEGIFIAQDMHIKFPNPKTCEILGYTREELLQIPFIELIHPEFRNIVAERHKRRLLGEELVMAYPFKAITKGGTVKWVEIKPVRIMWDGKPGTLSFMSDVTERKKEEEERKKLESQLDHARRMEAIGTLAGGIAHDFNNILGAILGYTELSLYDIPDDPPRCKTIKANLDHVLSAANRAKDLVKQILAFSRKDERERKPVIIKQIIKEALKLLRASLPSTIEIKTDFGKALLPVLADQTQIHQVIMNLCTNAGHAMRESGGLLEITLKEVELQNGDVAGKELEPGMYQRLSIRDTGHGMDKQTIARIFEPYFTTKNQEEGTGMGLAVVHGIVKSHHGEISVYSEPGEGTVFHVFLPVSKEKDPTLTVKAAGLKTGDERILMVDDEWVLAEMLQKMLERLGYTVEMKTSSVDALETFNSDPDRFQLVVTDQTMPGLTGLQLTEKIKSIRPDIPVILCTGFSEYIDDKNFIAHGIEAFVMKPVVMKEIADVIRTALDKNAES